MENLEKNYTEILQNLPNGVQLVAVSKTHPAEKIKKIYDLGQRVFGENKVQELVEKHVLLPSDIEWHLIGHLQTNKVKYIAPFIHTIQSVDSLKLVEEINSQAAKNNRKIKILLQIKIAEENTKFGLTFSEAKEIFHQYINHQFPNIVVDGVMGMATFTNSEEQIKKEFISLKKWYDELYAIYPIPTISMGMSGDYELAIDCGANSVRIGSAIFGSRSV